MAASNDPTVKDMPENPYQPRNICFSSRTFGVSKPTNRSFQSLWCSKFHWIHNDTVSDSAFCCKAIKMCVSGLTEHSFIVNGFINWRDAFRIFAKHEASNFHKRAVDSLKNKLDVEKMLSSQRKKENRTYLMQAVSSIRFLAQQGLALRGDGGKSDSNLRQLLLLQANDNSKIISFLETKKNKCTSLEI